MSVYEKSRPFAGDSFLVRIICHSQECIRGICEQIKAY